MLETIRRETDDARARAYPGSDAQRYHCLDAVERMRERQTIMRVASLNIGTQRDSGYNEKAEYTYTMLAGDKIDRRQIRGKSKDYWRWLQTILQWRGETEKWSSNMPE